jgi:hypothetical protein
MGVGISESWRGAELRYMFLGRPQRNEPGGFLSKLEKRVEVIFREEIA